MATTRVKEQQAFVEFRANPDNSLITIDEWATKAGIPVQTVYQWNVRKDVRERIAAFFNDNFRKDEVPVLVALIKRAKSGDPQAIKLYLQYCLEWSEKSEVKVSGNVADQIESAMKPKDAK